MFLGPVALHRGALLPGHLHSEDRRRRMLPVRLHDE
jgi:hypothetical protein